MKLTLLALFALLTSGCVSEHADGEHARIGDIPGHEGLPVDGRQMQGPRALPSEAYIRSFDMLLGAKSPAEAAVIAKGTDKAAMFEEWNDHVGALGLPNYADDIRRAPGTNAMMLGAFERLGMVVCERAAERDLRAGGNRLVFDFDTPDPADRNAFDADFDVVHRTLLGYPARLAPGRADRFWTLYADTVARHGDAAVTSRLSPVEAGWAVVCEGLVRHPELHLY